MISRPLLFFPCLFAAGLLAGCPQPNSVALGQSCKEKVECKEPATECVLALGRKLCTLPCGADDPCPDGFVCAAMELTIEGPEADAARLTATGGYCLPEAEVPPRAKRIRPRKGKRGRRSRSKGGRRTASKPPAKTPPAQARAEPAPGEDAPEAKPAPAKDPG